MSLTTNLQQWLEKLSKAISTSPLTQRARSHPLVSTAPVTAATLIALYLRHDYLIYLSIGPGGTPYNVFGWIASSFLLKPLAFGIDVRSTKPYENSTDPPYLPPNSPPKRSSEQPTIGPHPVPYRQLTQLPSAEIKAELLKRVKEIADQAKEKGILEGKPSGLELHTEALFVVPCKRGPNVASTADDATKGIGGEFAHVHGTGDHSLHMVLSATDCKKVFNAGWGERHAFDGHRLVKSLFKVDLSMQYIMVYTPRNEEEIDVVCQLLKAAIAYNTGVSVD